MMTFKIIKHGFTKYQMGSYGLDSDIIFHSKCFHWNSLIGKLFSKESGDLKGFYRVNMGL